MNQKSGLIIIALSSFGFGMITDRFLFSSKESVSEKGAKPISAEVQGNGPSKRNPNERDRRSDNDSDQEEDHFARQQEDPVRYIIEQIERGKRIDASTVSSLLADLPPGKKRREFIERVASHWGRKDPRSALAWTESLMPAEKSRAMERIIHEWAHTDPVGAAGYVTQIPKSQRSLDWVHAAAHIWAEQDHAAAIDWAMGLTDPSHRERALRGSTGVWARTDPAAASAFALEITDPYERHSVIESVARRWARQGTAESLEWALGMEGENRDRATMSIIEEISEHDPKQAAEVFSEISSSLSSEGTRESIHRDIARELASRWATANPIEAAEWVQGLPESEHIQREAAERVAERWAATNPQAAASWALELPESDNIRRQAVERVAGRWLRSDSLTASEWIADMPASEARDAATGELVRNISGSDPASALSWANSIGNDGYQTHLMGEVIERWYKTDPSAARSALQATDLSARQREKFKNILGTSAPAPEPSQGSESN